MVRRISSSMFIGRVAELGAADAALASAVQGEPGVVLLGGEAGIGKTRFVTEVSAIAAARGVSVVTGHCLEARATTLPYGPFVAILRELVRARADLPAPLAFDGRAVLTRLLPEISRDPDGQLHGSPRRDGPAASERRRLFDAVLELIGRTARDGPLLVVLEDLHWADTSSLDLIRFIAEELTTERVLVVGSFRTDEVERSHPLVALLGELVRLPHVLRLELAGFAQEEVAEQLTDITGHRPGVGVVQALFARSDGNPFFVEELAGRGTRTGFPATVQDVLEARLAGLSPSGRRVVLAAAAIGREAPHALIASVASLPNQALLEGLRDAIDRHVLIATPPGGPPGFVFRHALIQELAYSDLLPSERTAHHRAIVSSLLSTDGSPGEIARHALLGDDLPTALTTSVQAGDRAIDSLAFAEALAHLERALELWDRVDAPASLAGREQARLLAQAARCAVATGRWARAARLGWEAIARIDPGNDRDERVAMLLDVADAELLSDDEPAREAAIHEAADLVAGAPPSPLRARVQSYLAHLANHQSHADQGRQLAREALEMARALGAPAEEARALVRLAESLSKLMQPEAAKDLLAEAEWLAACGYPPIDDFVGYLRFRRAEIEAAAGGFERAIEIADLGITDAEVGGRAGQRTGFLRAIKASALAALGRWDQAEAIVEAELRDGAPVTSRMTLYAVIPVRLRQGRLVGAAEALRAIELDDVSLEGTSPLIESRWPVLEARIRLANADGRWDDARAAADEMVGLLGNAREDRVLAILELCVAGEADCAHRARTRRRFADADEARRVGLARLSLGREAVAAAIVEGGAGPLAEAILATAEAEGSRLEGGSDVAMWQEAVRLHEALRQPWETAYARFRQAEALLTTNDDRQHARSLLADAQVAAQSLGARPLLHQIDALARRARIRLTQTAAPRRRREATTDDGVVVTLTPRESEVLSLVAAGHTNREIGHTLFISEKTASVHVSNVMGKLGSLSRYDAAAAATRLGLLDQMPRATKMTSREI